MDDKKEARLSGEIIDDLLFFRGYLKGVGMGVIQQDLDRVSSLLAEAAETIRGLEASIDDIYGR